MQIFHYENNAKVDVHNIPIFLPIQLFISVQS